MQTTIDVLHSKFLPAVLICLVLAIGCGTSVAQTTAAQSDAQKAFEKLKTTVGSWQGTMMGKSISFTVRLMSSGNTILQEANSSSPPPDHEITTFYSTVIVCSRRTIATAETAYAGRENFRRMEKRLNSVFSISPVARGQDL